MGLHASLQASLASSGGLNPNIMFLSRIIESASSDKTSVELCHTILRGFPEAKSELPSDIYPYWAVRDNLSVCDNILIYKNRPIIPKPLRSEVIEHLHSAHQGVTGMKARACLYWPAMDNDIRNYRIRFRDCNTITPYQRKEPIILSESPEYPFQQVVVGYFQLKEFSYLLDADTVVGYRS